MGLLTLSLNLKVLLPSSSKMSVHFSVVLERPSGKILSMLVVMFIQSNKTSKNNLMTNPKTNKNKNSLKIGTWNLCLGLINKKDAVTDYLKSKNIAVCCIQETEIPCNYPEETRDIC